MNLLARSRWAALTSTLRFGYVPLPRLYAAAAADVPCRTQSLAQILPCGAPPPSTRRSWWWLRRGIKPICGLREVCPRGRLLKGAASGFGITWWYNAHAVWRRQLSHPTTLSQLLLALVRNDAIPSPTTVVGVVVQGHYAAAHLPVVAPPKRQVLDFRLKLLACHLPILVHPIPAVVRAACPPSPVAPPLAAVWPWRPPLAAVRRGSARVTRSTPWHHCAGSTLPGEQ